MSASKEIGAAIAAHGQWKHRLRSAIDTGQCDITAQVAKQDNQCVFGKWLHNCTDSRLKTDDYHCKVKQLHADFHQEAGRILQLGLEGKKKEAMLLIGIGSKFSKLSSQLTALMLEWQSKT